MNPTASGSSTWRELALRFERRNGSIQHDLNLAEHAKRKAEADVRYLKDKLSGLERESEARNLRENRTRLDQEAEVTLLKEKVRKLEGDIEIARLEGLQVECLKRKVESLEEQIRRTNQRSDVASFFQGIPSTSRQQISDRRGGNLDFNLGYIYSPDAYNDSDDVEFVVGNRTSSRQPLIVEYCLRENLVPFSDPIRRAMDQIEDFSRIRFQETLDDNRNLLCLYGKGCCYLAKDLVRGKDSFSRPFVHLCEDSKSVGAILHELMHAIGFVHEHQRPDRNRYVKVNWDAVGNENKQLFQKLSQMEYGFVIEDYEFDYASIMLFREFDFTKNRLPALEGKNRQLSDSKNKLSKMDKEKLRSL